MTADRGGADEHAFGKTVAEGGVLAGLRIAGHLLLARGGVFMPVANDDTDGFLTEEVAAFSNVRDTALALPHGLGARLSGSAIGRIGPSFGRIDVGVDYVQSIASDSSYPRLVGGRDVVIRSATGAGLALWSALVTAELAGALTVRDSINPPLAGVLSVQLPRGAWQPYIAAAAPVTRDDHGAAIALMIGLTVAPVDLGRSAPAVARSSTVVRREP